MYLPSPWFRYSREGDWSSSLCQPDGILFHPRFTHITIVEIKLSHTDRAAEQLLDLYTPVVERWLPGVPIAVCEVVRFFDCKLQYPVPYEVVSDVHRVEPGQFGVHILIPPRKELQRHVEKGRS